MKNIQSVTGVEINPKFVGALFTERIANTLRVFCFYTNGDTSQFDMSAEENLDSLQHLLSKLNVDENCSSVIVDEVVLGRVYVRSDGGCWLYTLLSTPGNVLPPFDTNICNLPWRHCWRSKAVDVLEYGKNGKFLHCFAIRTQISENDTARLVNQSKAFANPVSQQKRRPHRRLNLIIALAIACLGIPVAMTLFYTFKQSVNKSLDPSATTGATAGSMATGYYLLHNHQINGPYPAKIIANLSAEGLLDAETMCRAENNTEWVGLTTLFPPQLPKRT